VHPIVIALTVAALVAQAPQAGAGNSRAEIRFRDL